MAQVKGRSSPLRAVIAESRARAQKRCTVGAALPRGCIEPSFGKRPLTSRTLGGSRRSRPSSTCLGTTPRSAPLSDPRGAVVQQTPDLGAIFRGRCCRARNLDRATLSARRLLLSKVPRSATVTALSALDVLVITDQNFGGLLDKMLTLWPKLAQALAERVARDESASS